MKRMSKVALIPAVALLLAGCAPTPIAVAQLDAIPSSVDVGGAVSAGGEPAVGWGPDRDTFYVASVATGICIGVPTGVRAESPDTIRVDFSSSSAVPCPQESDIAWQLETPATIDTTSAITLLITVPNDGSLADDGTFHDVLR